MRRWWVQALVFALGAAVAFAVHELWASMLVAENVATTLLSGNVTRHLAASLGAGLFIAFRLVAFPLTFAIGARVAVSAFYALHTKAMGAAQIGREPDAPESSTPRRRGWPGE